MSGMRRLAEKKTPLDPGLVRALRTAVSELTSADDARRSAAVAGVMSVDVPGTLGILVDGLVGLLARCGDDTARRAAASLAGMGEASLSSLSFHLLKTRSESLQLRLVEVLAEIGSALPPQRRIRIQKDLGLALGTAPPPVAQAILRALDALHPATAGPLTTPPRPARMAPGAGSGVGRGSPGEEVVPQQNTPAAGSLARN